MLILTGSPERILVLSAREKVGEVVSGRYSPMISPLNYIPGSGKVKAL